MGSLCCSQVQKYVSCISFRKNGRNKHDIRQQDVEIKLGTIASICCFLSCCRREIRKPANTDASRAFSRFTTDQNSKEDGCLQPHHCFQDVTQALYLVSKRYTYLILAWFSSSHSCKWARKQKVTGNLI